MLSKYIHAAMQRAVYERLSDDGTYYGSTFVCNAPYIAQDYGGYDYCSI